MPRRKRCRRMGAGELFGASHDASVELSTIFPLGLDLHSTFAPPIYHQHHSGLLLFFPLNLLLSNCIVCMLLSPCFWYMRCTKFLSPWIPCSLLCLSLHSGGTFIGSAPVLTSNPLLFLFYLASFSPILFRISHTTLLHLHFYPSFCMFMNVYHTTSTVVKLVLYEEIQGSESLGVSQFRRLLSWNYAYQAKHITNVRTYLNWASRPPGKTELAFLLIIWMAMHAASKLHNSKPVLIVLARKTSAARVPLGRPGERSFF